jgi:hypothetical protein
MDVNAWGRLPSESAKAYAAFSLYLEMDTARSLAAVGRKCGKHKSLLERWSVRHHWQERARDYDAALAQTDFENAISARREMKYRHRQVARLLIEKAAQAARKINANKLGASACARIFDAATRAERAALGESDEQYASVTINVRRAEDAGKVTPK